MRTFGFLSLVLLMVMFFGIEIVSSNPCSQFSDPNRQAFCTSDSLPGFVANEEE